ncbi:MAG TPA: carbohydrate ABC transporter permease [Clostridiales bacterium]|nr:carbohydrate ABC transporter permease [Clostridiales bacterium]
MKKKAISQIILNIIVIALLVVMIYPLAMTLWGAFKNSFTYDQTKWYPTLPLRVTNIASAYKSIKHYIFNTIFVAVTATAGSLAVASLAAYAFARMEFVGKNFLYLAVISLMMIPGVLTLVPSYVLYKNIVGLNNYLVLILPTVAGGPVFGVFLLRSFYEGLPESVFESARIDGANELRVFFSICIPMSMSIMGTLVIMQIMSIWNEYLWPIITIQDDRLLTISAGLLQRFSNVTGVPNYPITFSAYLVSSIPLIVLFFAANKYYIEGLTSSAIKL